MQELFNAPRKKEGRFVEAKDYLPAAIVTLFAYCTVWPVGLVANIVWLREASNVEKDLGTAPPNKGCLVWLMWFNLLVAGLFFLFFLAVVYFSMQQVITY
jgi:hypothetical protein